MKIHETPADWVSASLDKHAARHHLKNVQAVYCYEDVAADTFTEAKKRGLFCIYDLPILFYRKSYEIQKEEAELYPDLSPAFKAIQEPKWKIDRKEMEADLADHILVASSNTKRSLVDTGINESKISVIPYGAPVNYFIPMPKKDDHFRALFVGLIHPRKGVHYLLKAWQELQLQDSELTLVGTDQFPKGWLAKYSVVCKHVPSVSHTSLNQYYNSANVFVFPSLVEGFGLVLLEAMACGIPVITTPNTAGPDIITDGVEGFIVPIRDVGALKEKLEWCRDNPEVLTEMGLAARKKAECLSWEKYRTSLALRVKQLLGHES